MEQIAARLGILPSSETIANTIERRTAVLGQLSWPEFIQKALADWPPYIPMFVQLAECAAPGDELALQFLVEHECALVEFAGLESENNDLPISLAPLRLLLTK